ncbi:hypothetical protein B5S33_g4703 [[Candida] boidinii]|nr:hypothetical protein B5S30_g1204 [[Candida] boidinii]OWB86024.1 hypothetical protein B5S33_g4703 [[Candida] boidinii]
MIQLLPNEIIQIIIEQLSQSDCFHLCIVNKNFNELCLPKLYRSITIDSKLTIYHNELNFTNDLRKLPSNIDYYNNKKDNNSILKPNFTKITIIKTYYGLKRFFKTVLNNLNLINLINYLEISKNLPDNFIEIEFIKNLKDYLFPNLNNLKFLIFHYQSCFLNLNNLILSLPEFNRNVPHINSNNLLKIDCDFLDLNNEKRRKLSSPSSLSRQPKNQIYNKLKSLNQLTLINFQNGENLKILNLNNNLELINNLKFLELSRLSKLTFPINFKIFKSIGLDFNLLQENFNKFFYNNMTNSLNNNDFNSILSNNPIPMSSSSSSNGLIDAESISNNYYETEIIKCLFGNTQTPPDRHHKKLKLKKLKLDSITVCLNDFKILNSNIDLLELEILELLNVSEIMNDDSNNSPNSLRSYLLANSDNNNNDDDDGDGDFPVPDNMDPEEAELLAMQMLSRNETNSLIPIRRRLDDSDFFLFKISPFLKNLKILTIDFYNDFKDFTPVLIKNIDHLIQLYININWNQSRDNLFNKSYDELIIDYFNNLLKHSLNLKILIIDSKNESNYNSSPIFQRTLSSSANSSKDNLEIKDLNINILSKFLPNFKNLVNLRLPINENCLLSFLENNLMFLNNLKFIEIIFPQVNSYSSFNFNDSHSSSNNANNNDTNYSANNSLISNTHAHLGTLLNPIPTSDINSMNFNYNSDTTLLNSIFNDDDPDENNSNGIDETVLEFNKIWQNTSLKSKLDIDTQKNKMNFKDLHQISLIFKKFIGIKSEIENSSNNCNHNHDCNSSFGSSSSFNVMKYQSGLKYLKIFNVIICVDDIKNIKFKTNSLDEWFNLKLTGNL